MQDNSCRGINRKCRRILNTVIRADKLYTETSKIDVLSVFDNFSLYFFEHIMLFEFVLDQGIGQSGRINRHIDIF